MENKEKNISYVSVAELAKMLEVSRITIFNRIKKGKIPAEKIGRSYAIPFEFMKELIDDSSIELTEDKKKGIRKAVEKVIKEYGETLKLLGKE